MASQIIVDGQLQEGGELSLDASSQGLAYGYGVFETIKLREGKPCFFSEHLARLAQAAEDLGLPLGPSREELLAQSLVLAEANQADQGTLKILHFANGSSPSTVLLLRDMFEDAGERYRLRQSLLVRPSMAFSTRHKTLNYLENWRQLQAARQHAFDECLFVNELGCVTECATANLFFASEGKLKTPQLDCGLLDGIARAQVIAAAEQEGLLMEEGRYLPEELLRADEVFITNSSLGARGVAEIETGATRKVFDERNSLTKRMAERLLASEKESIDAF